MLYNSSRALQLLRLGSSLKDATFRHKQEEAIRHIVEGRGRLLVVQRTGWGKSFVYFIATKLLREQGYGPALLISPWVVSRADEGYPARLRNRLKDLAPPVLYGCGDPVILNNGGLAVVGSRNADAQVLESTRGIGELAARTQRTIISGGARGIDQAAMSGALEAGGNAAGVLADSLERAALNRDHRNYLRDGQLVLLSPYDPQAGFNIGNAMQRNKLIYALADAALVVQVEYGKGGTWAGAIEQLDKLHLVPVYTLPNAQQDAALETLGKTGALTWPNPTTPEEFREALTVRSSSSDTEQLSFLADNGNL